jgi:hypothetical protein
MAGVKGRSGRRHKVSQTVIEAMSKYRDNIDKLSKELYDIAKNKKVAPGVRLQAIILYLEKCVPKLDYEDTGDNLTLPTYPDLEEYYAKKASESMETGGRSLEDKNDHSGGLGI